MRNRAAILALAAAYALAALFFFEEICDYFEYVPGYQCSPIEWTTGLVHVILAWIPAFFLRTDSAKPSSTILWFVYFTHVVPSILMPPLLLSSGQSWGVVWTASISFLYCLVAFASEKIELRIPRYGMRSQTFYVVVTITLCASIASIVSVFGWNLDPPSIDDVYEVRSQFIQAKEAAGAVLVGYIVVIGGFLLAPLSLIIAVRDMRRARVRSLILASLALLLAFSIYCAGGFKSVAFAALVAPLGYAVAKKFTNRSLLLAIGVPMGAFLIFAIAHSLDAEIVFNHWYRRVFMVPGMNSSYFYDYISSHDLWRLPSAPTVISAQYYGTDGSANAGLFADGLAFAGYFGMLFNSALFALLLALANACARDIDNRIAFAMYLLTAYAISNSALTSVFLTYGFAFLCVFFVTGRSALRKLN